MSATTVPIAAQHPRDAAVACMNRGHALMQRGGPDDLSAACAAYGEAIALLRTLPTAENAAWANSLGAALMNRGQLLHRIHGLARADDALADFAAAASLLRPLIAPAVAPLSTLDLQLSTAARPATPWPRRNFAGTCLNRANLLLDLGRPADARDAAQEALGLCSAGAKTDPVDADLVFKSHRAFCDALGQLLVAPGADQDALAHEAGDHVEAALALIRFWHARLPAAPFTGLAERFYRYGAQLYRFHQPHFLAEFLLEYRSIAPAHDAIARETLAATRRDLATQRFDLDTSHSTRQLAIAASIRTAEDRLRSSGVAPSGLPS